jgi:K(+)-stimulated pyrophosphate-energized sodium pump
MVPYISEKRLVAATEMCTSMSKEECMEKGCESKTCKFMGAGTSKTVTNSKEVSIEKQM